MQVNQACAKEIKFSYYYTDFLGDALGSPRVLVNNTCRTHTVTNLQKSHLISNFPFISLLC